MSIITETDKKSFRKAIINMRAINHKLRQSILELIVDNREISVTDLYVQLRLEQSVASQHLAILRRAGLVKTRRDGKFIYYSVDQARIDFFKNITEQINN